MYFCIWISSSKIKKLFLSFNLLILILQMKRKSLNMYIKLNKIYCKKRKLFLKKIALYIEIEKKEKYFLKQIAYLCTLLYRFLVDIQMIRLQTHLKFFIAINKFNFIRERMIND